jgi:hypothetical protein
LIFNFFGNFKEKSNFCLALPPPNGDNRMALPLCSAAATLATEARPQAASAAHRLEAQFGSAEGQVVRASADGLVPESELVEGERFFCRKN